MGIIHLEPRCILMHHIYMPTSRISVGLVTLRLELSVSVSRRGNHVRKRYRREEGRDCLGRIGFLKFEIIGPGPVNGQVINGHSAIYIR